MKKNQLKYAVFEHLQGFDKGARFWSSNDGNYQIGQKVCGTKKNPWYKIVHLTNDENDAITNCGNLGLINHFLRPAKTNII